jgi:hypothetical protein
VLSTLSSLVFIPIEGERIVVQKPEYLLSNYRLVQYDRGSKTTVSLPLHMIKEYKLTPTAAMFKVTNGIVNVLGTMPQREELRGALSLREYERLRVGDQKKLCDVCGVPFIHPDQPYSRWICTGYHQDFCRRFYEGFAWLKGEEIFTYFPDSFLLTTYRLYQYDAKTRKLFMFPMNMVQTFEAKGNKLLITAVSGKFEIRGKVPRQDHLLRVWQARAWESLPKTNLDWLIMPLSQMQKVSPLPQYAYTDMTVLKPMAAATESREDIQVSAAMPAGTTTVFMKPVIKDRCSYCNAPLSWEKIDWVGPDQYACPSCKSSHRVEYIRI